MALYLVSYDLIGPNRDYERITRHLMSYGTRAKPLESVWIVESNKTAIEVRDAVHAAADSNDKILVVQIGKGWGTWNVSKETTDWMHRNL